MRKAFKIIAGVAIAGVVIGLGAVAFAQFASERKLHRTIAVNVAPIEIPGDDAALMRGEYLYKSRGCADCHGADAAGKVVFDEAGFYVKAPLIATGEGSATAAYRPEDWVRTIRHGVKPDGQPVLVMPSEDFNRLTDADVGAIVGYVRSLPPTVGTGTEFRIPLIVRFLYAVGAIKDAAEKIDHTLPPAEPFASGDEIAHGAYVAAACKGCHNDSFSGGPIPGAPPTWPPSANLTSGPDSAIARYPNAETLAAMFRSGKRPDGSAVNSAMPFSALSQMSDDDIHALHAFLKTLPPLKQGEKRV